MVLSKSHIFFLVALIAANLIFGQETTNSPNDATTSGPQQNTQVDANQAGEGDGSFHNRFFFFTRFVGCNSTAQAGRTCASCRQTLLCLSNNIGILKTCHGFLPYCNGGRCSYIGGSACNSTTSG
ncbi:unnamed protein product [Parnassius apollo]|uniref:(apollo) hypothetical protein n=1 Tax=Parnassius apollo TaxID=110799 RepID=A0A8S3WFW9_PARAO|nr:unnamed protein product [Parnassius apollo]